MVETQIPIDFIIDKKDSIRDSELEQRFLRVNGCEVFQKEKRNSIGAPQGASPDNGNGSLLKEFRGRYLNLRDFIIDLCLSRLREIFRQNAFKVYGDAYPHCSSIDDYVSEYRTGVYDNAKRGTIFGLCNRIWGKECCAQIETMVMNQMKLKYTNFLSSGNSPKTNRKGGSIGVMINRCRQTFFVERLRYVWRVSVFFGFNQALKNSSSLRSVGRLVHKEILYSKKNKTKRLDDGTVVNILPKGVVKIVKVTYASHGYDGYLGICMGHKTLVDDARPVMDAGSGSFEQFALEMSQSEDGSKMNAAELLKAYQDRNGTEVIATDDTSNTSTLTGSTTNTTTSTAGSSNESVSTVSTVCSCEPCIWRT